MVPAGVPLSRRRVACAIASRRSIERWNPRNYSDDTTSPIDSLTNSQTLVGGNVKMEIARQFFNRSTLRVVSSVAARGRRCHPCSHLCGEIDEKSPLISVHERRKSLWGKIERDRALHHFQLARSAEYLPPPLSLSVPSRQDNRANIPTTIVGSCG